MQKCGELGFLQDVYLRLRFRFIGVTNFIPLEFSLSACRYVKTTTTIPFEDMCSANLCKAAVLGIFQCEEVLRFLKSCQGSS